MDDKLIRYIRGPVILIVLLIISRYLFPSKMTAFFTRKEHLADAVREAVPLCRLGAPADIAGLALCLCGAGGAYISGAVVMFVGLLISLARLRPEPGKTLEAMPSAMPTSAETSSKEQV